MTRQKKSFAVVALLLVLCLLFTACGNKAEEEASDPAESETTEAPETTGTEENEAEEDANAGSEIAAGLEASEEDPIQMAFVIPYELDSLPWLLEFCEEIPAYDEAHPEVEMTIVEALEADKYEPLCRSFCEDGYEMIFAFYNNFTETVKTLSAEFPDVLWFAFDGYYSDEQLAEIPTIIDFHEDLAYAYAVGACAAMMTETNKIAMVYGADISFNMELAGVFQDGVYSVNPDIEITNVIANTYVDPQVGYETGKSLATQGYDVIFANAGTTENGLIQACHEAGIYYAADSASYVDGEYGDCQIATRRAHVNTMHIDMAEAALTGDFVGGTCYEMPVGSGTALEINEDVVPAEIVEQLKEIQAKLESGEIVPNKVPAVW